jgi:hypothetical protein
MVTEDRRIYSESHKCNDQQRSSDKTQPGMRYPVEQPAESDAFERPAKGDPLSIELNWKNQRDEKQRRATK